MTDDIDTLSRRRRILLSVYGILFLALQPSVFHTLDDPYALWQPIHFALAAGYVGWSATLIYILSTGGLLFGGRRAETRAALNDELTQANRRAAYRFGYWMLLGTIVILYVMSIFTTVTLQEALRLLFAFGVAIPATTFAGKERKQSGE